MTFDFEALRSFLRCPQSRSELVLDDEGLVSVDPACRLKYPIREGIPTLLVDDATELSPEDWSAVMSRHNRDPETGAALSPGAASDDRS